jgi:DNA-binding transcriptional MerR regulator
MYILLPVAVKNERAEMEDGGWTTSRLAETVGLPERKILSFIERGYIKPSVLDAAGPGSRRLWSFQDIVKAYTAKLLIEAGQSVQQVRGIMQGDDLMFERGVIMVCRPDEDPQVYHLSYKKNHKASNIMQMPLDDFDFDHHPIQTFISIESIHLKIRKFFNFE